LEGAVFVGGVAAGYAPSFEAAGGGVNDPTYQRIRAALCDESTIDLEEHAAAVCLVVLDARFRASRDAAAVRMAAEKRKGRVA
jgi:hypothetical protein